MRTIKGNPPDGVPARAPTVHRLDVLPTACRRLRGVLGRTLVVLDKGVADGASQVDGQDIVGDAVLGVVSHGLGAGAASAEVGTAHDGHATEDVWSRAGKRVGHGTAVTPAHRVDLVIVDAELGLELLPNLVEEGDVLAALVGPAIVQTLRSDEDSAVTGQRSDAVVISVGHVLHGSTEPVGSKDELVRFAAVIVVGQRQDVLSLFPVHSGRECPALQSGGLATSLGGVARTSRGARVCGWAGPAGRGFAGNERGGGLAASAIAGNTLRVVWVDCVAAVARGARRWTTVASSAT